MSTPYILNSIIWILLICIRNKKCYVNIGHWIDKLWEVFCTYTVNVRWACWWRRRHVHVKHMAACVRLYRADTHSESLLAVIQLGGVKLGICGRLTLGTVRFGTLGIWRLTVGRVLVIVLWRKENKEKESQRQEIQSWCKWATKKKKRKGKSWGWVAEVTL